MLQLKYNMSPEKTKNFPKSDKTFKLKDLWPEFCQWCYFVAENTTVHGLVWYTRIQNNSFRFLVFVLCVLVLIGLPVIMVKELIKFSHDKSVLSSQDWVKSNNITYPNITVCHPAYFDGEKLKSKSQTHFHRVDTGLDRLSMTSRFVLNFSILFWFYQWRHESKQFVTS